MPARPHSVPRCGCWRRPAPSGRSRGRGSGACGCRITRLAPYFARAFVDGRFYDGIDHAEALGRVRCPLLVLHGDWFRDERHGLVGAMDDDDAARILRMVPHARYERVRGNHVLHFFRPRRHVKALIRELTIRDRERAP